MHKKLSLVLSDPIDAVVLGSATVPPFPPLSGNDQSAGGWTTLCRGSREGVTRLVERVRSGHYSVSGFVMRAAGVLVNHWILPECHNGVFQKIVRGR